MEYLNLLLKFIGISTILLIFYYLLYARRATFFQCRVYLLSMVVVAFLLSVSQFKVYPAETRTIYSQEVVEVVEENRDEVLIDAPLVEVSDVEEVAQKEVNLLPEPKVVREPLSSSAILTITYFAVVLLLLIRYFYQLYKIHDLTRWGSVTTENGIQLIRNNKVTSPFSYFKRIYLNRKLEGETLDVVLEHERCHIKHRHYVDALAIELLSIVLWFNPLVWFVKHELRNIHEFQVDRSLINNGLEIAKYQTIIFAELMGYSPEIANGFHNSMIKKRFVMMNNQRIVKYNTIRKIVLLPLLVLLLALFSFTSKDDVVNYVTLPAPVKESADALLDSVALRDTLKNNIGSAALKVVREVDLEKVPYTVVDSFNKELSKSIDKFADKVKQYTGSDSIDMKATVSPKSNSLSLDKMIFTYKKPFRIEVKSIVVKEDQTLVTVIVPILRKKQQISISSELVLQDVATRESYKIERVLHDVPLGESFTVEGGEDKVLELTFQFSPLKKGVTYVHMKKSGQSSARSSELLFNFPNLSLERYAPVKYDYNRLREDQLIATSYGKPSTMKLGPKFVNGSSQKLLNVNRTDTSTLVTVSVPIYYDNHWISFSSGFVLRDCKTHEKYYIKGMLNDIPLDRVNIVSGKRGKRVVFTMIFPRLPEKTERIDILEVPHSKTVRTPPNGATFGWYDIFVKNNKFRPNDDNNLSINNSHPAQKLVTEISSKGRPEMELSIRNNGKSYLLIKPERSEVVTIPRDFSIRDVVSGKVYKAIRLTSHHSFNTPFLFSRGEVVSLEFENIPYGVDKIDIGVFTENGETEHNWSYKNIEINN